MNDALEQLGTPSHPEIAAQLPWDNTAFRVASDRAVQGAGMANGKQNIRGGTTHRDIRVRCGKPPSTCLTDSLGCWISWETGTDPPDSAQGEGWDQLLSNLCVQFK